MRNLNVRHESSDVNIKGVFWVGASLIIGGLLTYSLIWGMTDYFKSRSAETELNLFPLANERRRIPPEPRLQGAPGHVESGITEWHQFQDHENGLLHSYGWIDKRAGIVRLPIERAKELFLQRGFPEMSEIPATGTGPKAESPPRGKSTALFRSKKPTQGVKQ